MALSIKRLVDRHVRAFYVRHSLLLVEVTGYDVGKDLFDLGLRDYRLLDGTPGQLYRTTTLDGWLRAISASWVSARDWLTQERDCDDYALPFKTHMMEHFGLTAVAIVITQAHVWNRILTSDSGGCWFEPQLDAFVDPEDMAQEPYLLAGAQLLI